MKSGYRQLGEFIRQVDVRNKNLEIDNLLGVSIEKRFIPSIANTVGTDFSSYKIVRRGQFAYGPVTSRNGNKISIAYLNDEDAIISSSYTVFEITECDVIDPEYLMLWFSRPEFDRYARFKSHGSVREIFDWDEMCKVELPVPDIEEQKKIVHAYKVIEDRINLKKRINENLEGLAYLKYKSLISNTPKNAVLSDIANIVMGTSPEGDTLNSKSIGTLFYQGKTDFGFRFPTVRQYTTNPKRYAKKGDILMSVRAPVGPVNIASETCAIGRGLAALSPKDGRRSYLYYTMFELNFELNKFNNEGTVFGSITKDELFSLPVVNLHDGIKEVFETDVSIIDEYIMVNEEEISLLNDMKYLLLDRISKLN